MSGQGGFINLTKKENAHTTNLQCEKFQKKFTQSTYKQSRGIPVYTTFYEAVTINNNP